MQTEVFINLKVVITNSEGIAYNCWHQHVCITGPQLYLFIHKKGLLFPNKTKLKTTNRNRGDFNFSAYAISILEYSG